MRCILIENNDQEVRLMLVKMCFFKRHLDSETRQDFSNVLKARVYVLALWIFFVESLFYEILMRAGETLLFYSLL